MHTVNWRNLLPLAALVLATGGVAADGGQQSELVVYAGGRLGAGVPWLDALLVLVAVAGATGAGLAFGSRWPALLLAAAPLDVVLLVASLNPPADLRLALVVVATATRLVSLLAVLAGAQERDCAPVVGLAVGAYVAGSYMPGAHWFLAAGAVGGLLAAAVGRPGRKPSPHPVSTVDRRVVVVGTLASLLALLPLALTGRSPQETLGLTGFVFAAAAVVLGSLFGWRALLWLLATAFVVLGIGLPLGGGVSWPYMVLGVVAGCALSFLPYRAFIAAALCLVSAFVGSSVPGIVFAALACLAAAALPSLVKRSSTPAVFGPLLAVAVTAGSELILWSEVTFYGQQGGVLFGDGQVTVPLLCAAAAVAVGLGVVETLNS